VSSERFGAALRPAMGEANRFELKEREYDRLTESFDIPGNAVPYSKPRAVLDCTPLPANGSPLNCQKLFLNRYDALMKKLRPSRRRPSSKTPV
jgi:hypothetical protein